MGTYTHIRWIVFGAGVWVCCLGIGQADAGFLESPAPTATLSGIGFISGWKCDAQDITVRIDGGPPMDMAMDIPREDTRSTCDGEANNGFIIQTNWNNLSAGTHTAVAYDNGIEFDRNTFTVGTPGEKFLRGVMIDIDVLDFPASGKTSRFVWNESTQHLELAEVYPDEDIQPPSPPEDTSVSRFNGVWQFTFSNYPPGCQYDRNTTMTCTIAQGSVSCRARSLTRGAVSTSGDITIEIGDRYFQGRLGENEGAGTWGYYSNSCNIEWTATKQSSFAGITSRVCGTLRGLQVEDYDENLGRWDIANPCAPWNGYANVLHIDVVPLSPAGFDMDTGDMMIVQGNRRVTYDEDNPDITQALFWVDQQTQVVSTRTILPYRLTEGPYRITVIVGRNTGLDLRQPFTLYYDDKLVAIFE